ncbi:MAG: LamG-like jellyroll fold domain-containing protein [Armatimonadota bacterium]
MRYSLLVRQLTLLAGLLIVLSTAATAAGKRLYQDAFAAGDIKGWTLQPPINPVGPIPANGTWKTDGNALVATGTAAPWTVQTGGDANWTDYQLSASVTIRKPGPRADFPIYACEYDRFLPREDFPPFSGHSGEYRYRYFAGEFDWGSEAAIYVRYQDRANCYRVQLSTEYQEMILWNGNGGYLQVVPCKLVPGQTYKLDVLAQGTHLQVSLNGKKTIDYWHTCMQSLRGGIGLAAYNSTVAFQNVQVTALPALTTGAPAHQAKFFTRKWRGLRWVFDSNEPLLLFEKNIYQESLEKGKPQELSFLFVKLRPGYRPYYNTFVGLLRDNAPAVGLPYYEDDIPVSGENSDRLTIQFDGVPMDKDKSLSSHHTDVLTFDRIRGTYRHDIIADVTFLRDQKISSLEYCDPLTYNNHRPGRGVKYTWSASNDDWGVFDGDDGNIYRHPISKGLQMGEGWYTKGSPSFWMLYPGRAACPVWEHIEPADKTWVIVCHWGHDYHNAIRWESGRNFKKDEKYTIHYVMTAYTQEEGERIFQRSKLNPLHANIEEKNKNSLFNYVPSPYAFPIMDPAGTSFEELQNVREPFTGWHTMGDYTMDREVGRTDHYSLRLDGPSSMTGTMYHNMFDIYAKKYLCTLWLKTKGVSGKGPKVTMKYTFDAKPCDTFETGLNGDNDWQQLSFITSVPATHDSTDIIVEHTGAGTVWVDDFSLRPIEEGENVVEHRPTPRPTPALTPSADYLLYLPCTEGAGVSLIDASNHGNAAKLHGVTWITTGKRPALHFENGATAFAPNLSPELQSQKDGSYAQAGVTIDAWVRPSAGKGGGSIIGYLNSPHLTLQPRDAKSFTLSFSLALLDNTYLNLTSTQPVLPDVWTHVAATVTADGMAKVYINGKPAGEKKLANNKFFFRNYYPMISIGTYGKMYGSPYTGDMMELRWWSRAATDAEMAATAANQP